MSTKQFFIYVRKSTDDPHRQVRSIEDQIAELQELARREQIDVIEILQEKQTAKLPGRPVFNTMLKRVEKGEATGILAWHPDRLARNSIDAGKIIYFVDTGKITDLRFPTFKFDPSSSGKFMLSIMLGYSKYYVDNLSENIKRGQRHRMMNGYWPKPAPLGYRNDGTGILQPDPATAPLVRKAFQLYASGGYPLTRLKPTMTELGLRSRGGKPLSLSHFQHLLNSPIYYGLIRHDGEYYQGKHDPLVSKSLFDAAQEVMACRGKPNVRSHVSCLYRGMFRCGECGATITSEIQKGHEYLRCTKRLGPCSQPYMRLEEVNRQVDNLLQAFILPDAIADDLLTRLDDYVKDEAKAQADLLAELRNDIKSVDERLDRLMAVYLEQAVTIDEYRTAKNELVAKRQELQVKVKDVTTATSSWFEPARKLIDGLKSTVFENQTGSGEKRRDFLKMVGSNLQITDKVISLVPRMPWKTLVEWRGLAGVKPGTRLSGATPLVARDQTALLSCPLSAVRSFLKDKPQEQLSLAT